MKTNDSNERLRTTMSDNETTALAPAPASDGSWLSTARQLAERVPLSKRDDVLMSSRPSPSQLMDLVSALPAGAQESMADLVRKTNPKKQGAHGSRMGFRPTAVKLYQGTGNDPVRPPKMSSGEFYSADSRVLGEKLDIAILGFYEGRTLWPARDSGEKNPLCWSWDRQMGSRYGECSSCPMASKRTNEGGCGSDITFWFVDLAMTGLYSLTFSRTSYGAGSALQKIITKSENIWDRVIRLETQERTVGDKRWYVIKASPVIDVKNPKLGDTDRALHPMFRAMSQILDADVYYPNLAEVYDRAKGAPEASAGAEGEVVDVGALLGNSATEGDNPDFSVDT